VLGWRLADGDLSGEADEEVVVVVVEVGLDLSTRCVSESDRLTREDGMKKISYLVVSRSEPLGDGAIVGDVDGSGWDAVASSVEGAVAWDVVLREDGSTSSRSEEGAEVGVGAASDVVYAWDWGPDLKEEKKKRLVSKKKSD